MSLPTAPPGTRTRSFDGVIIGGPLPRPGSRTTLGVGDVCRAIDVHRAAYDTFEAICGTLFQAEERALAGQSGLGPSEEAIAAEAAWEAASKAEELALTALAETVPVTIAEAHQLAAYLHEITIRRDTRPDILRKALMSLSLSLQRFAA